MQLGLHRVRAARYLAKRLWAWRSRSYPRDENGLVRLHVGCGDIDAPGFVNVDARAYPHVHIVTRQLFDLWSVPPGVASLVYMCHVLEHVPYGEVVGVLREMRRVLSPGGTLRLSVPDFDLIVVIYRQRGNDAEAILGPLMGGQDYPFNFHYTVFNSDSLSRALASAGLESIRPWDPSTCEHHDFVDWANRPVEIGGALYPISLNLEASAPGAPSASMGLGLSRAGAH